MDRSVKESIYIFTRISTVKFNASLIEYKARRRIYDANFVFRFSWSCLPDEKFTIQRDFDQEKVFSASIRMFANAVS